MRGFSNKVQKSLTEVKNLEKLMGGTDSKKFTFTRNYFVNLEATLGLLIFISTLKNKNRVKKDQNEETLYYYTAGGIKIALSQGVTKFYNSCQSEIKNLEPSPSEPEEKIITDLLDFLQKNSIMEKNPGKKISNDFSNLKKILSGTAGYLGALKIQANNSKETTKSPGNTQKTTATELDVVNNITPEESSGSDSESQASAPYPTNIFSIFGPYRFPLFSQPTDLVKNQK